MGIVWDGSEWQHDKVNFQVLKGEVDFVILRDQHGYSHKDNDYDAFAASCKQYGIPFDTYSFFAAVNPSDAIAEAKADADRMDKQSKVAWIDVEQMTKANTKEDLQASVNAYYDALKAAGWEKVGLYAGEYFYNANGLANCKKDCLWIAAYGSNDGTMQTAYRPQVPGADLWQYTSKGRLSAVQGDCDLSIMIGCKPLAYFTGSVPMPYSCGQEVVLQLYATQYQTGQDILPEAKGKTYKIIQTKVVGGREACLLDGIMSWVWAQDIKIPVYPTPAPPAPPAPVAAPAPAPVVVKAVPVEAPPAEAAAVAAPPPGQEEVNFIISELKGQALGDLQTYIFNKGWWYNVSRDSDDTLTIEVGIFIKDSKAFNDFKAFLDAGKYTYSNKASTI